LATINKEKRDKIIAQALQEITFARTYKQGKIRNWQKNEDLYYSKKVTTPDSRANVDLGRMQEFVHTLLSKIDNPLIFKFTKRKESQLKRVTRLNSIRVIDQENDFWDLKDIVGKKQGIIYGRTIYAYYADSYKKYCSHLENVDVYDFLIDPSAGGIDIERAMYLGDYGVVLTKSELKEGVKSGLYLKTETNLLIEGTGNVTESSQEETNKSNRTYDQNVYTSRKEIPNPDKFKFWRWGTTFEGQRYYLLLSEKGATAIRLVEIEEVFESGLWWYWTWAAFPDLTEFWTPSYCDYVREIFMAQSVSINQMLDNAEQVNKPQQVVNVGAIENLAELKYKKGGLIKVKKEFDANKAVQNLIVPSINTPIQVFNILEGIQEKASGVTSGAKGVSEDEKVAVYEGNQAAAADRFGLLNKSYTFGYKRFATLWEHGVREHLIKKIAVDMIGPDGVEVEEVSRRDIFRKDDKFGVMVEASNAEMAISEVEKKIKLAFLAGEGANPQPLMNAKKGFEMRAQIAGFTEEEIRQLMDTSDFGDAELMSEADRDIERILDGEDILPNEAATNAYKQRFVTYMTDKKENITFEQFEKLAMYIFSLDDIIAKNTVRQVEAMGLKEMRSMSALGPDGKPMAPIPEGAGSEIVDEAVEELPA